MWRANALAQQRSASHRPRQVVVQRLCSASLLRKLGIFQLVQLLQLRWRRLRMQPGLHSSGSTSACADGHCYQLTGQPKERKAPEGGGQCQDSATVEFSCSFRFFQFVLVESGQWGHPFRKIRNAHSNMMLSKWMLNAVVGQRERCAIARSTIMEAAGSDSSSSSASASDPEDASTAVGPRNTVPPLAFTRGVAVPCSSCAAAPAAGPARRARSARRSAFACYSP